MPAFGLAYLFMEDQLFTIYVHHLIDLVPNLVEPQSVAEPVIQRNGRLGALGNGEWGKTADNGVHRECHPYDAVQRNGDVDVWSEREGSVEEHKDRVCFFGEH